MRDQIITIVLSGTGTLILSAAMRALPEPLPMGSRFYMWFYRFIQIVMANLDKNDAAKKL